MQPSQAVMDALFYGSVISALIVAVLLLQFYRREQQGAYLAWSFGFLIAALRYGLPATHLAPDSLMAPVIFYFTGLRGALMIWGAVLFYRLPRRPSWLLVLFLVPALWIWAGMRYRWGFDLLTFVPALVGSAGYLLLGVCFLLNQPAYRWNGHRLFALGAILEAVHILDYPFLRETSFAPWGFAIAQLLHYLMAVALLVIWVRQEEYRALTAYQSQERALRRVLRSRRRVIEMLEWNDTLLQQISDGVLIGDHMGVITGFNHGAERIFGYGKDEVLGRPVDLLLPGAGDVRSLGDRRDAGVGQPREMPARHRRGSEFTIEATVSQLSVEDSRQYVIICRDISERKEQEERLNYLAAHDGLTGLPNRRSFEQQLETLLHESNAGWLLFLDLDDFKLINDSLGHSAGDAALVAMARRLKAQAGEGSLVARHSGDEFVIFRPEDDIDWPQWLESLLASVRQPIAFDDMELMLSSSVGIVHYPTQASEVDDLVRNADLAMYNAKRAGKNKYSHYRPQMLAELNRTADIATRLKKLDMDAELFPVFQPRMNLEGRRLSGAEVLLRWRTPEGEMIPPDRFIPVAEETGQILRLGYWVMEQSCRFLSRWRYQEDPLILSINLSARQLFDEQLVDRIEDLRNRYSLSPAQLEFEITESSAMQDLDYALRVLSRLRALGYGLSLDDFGTGFSSLSHLRQMPVNTVKIDRSFVNDMARDRQDRVLVASIIELASHLDMRVLAEGVEDIQQLELLDSLGCDEVQGYLVSRPLEAEEFSRRILQNWEQVRQALLA